MEQTAMLNPEEARRILRIGRNTFYQSAKSGGIPGVVHFGRKVLVKRAVLMAWLGNEVKDERN